MEATLRRLIGEHAVRHVSSPVRAHADEMETVEPVGMTLAEQRELACLIELADAGVDGDEEATIERLVDTLESARPGGSAH